MTLLEAKNALAKVADNGVCVTDSRLVDRINEAQRRLHSLRPWLGTLVKVAVNVVSQKFDLPSGTGVLTSLSGFGVESALRVSVYTPTGSEIGYPLILTSGVHAFVNDSGRLIQVVVNQANPRTYSVEDASVTHVEITGKLSFTPAVNDNDLVLIDDLDALKLMMLALWREENNQLELSQALETKAIERLTIKTDGAVESARRIAYQTRASNATYGTMGFVRSKLALDLKGGLRMDDSELIDLINKGQDMMVDEYNLLIKAGRYGVKAGLPNLAHSFVVNDDAELAIGDYQVNKLSVMAVQALNAGQADVASALEKEAISQLENTLLTNLETSRHTTHTTTLQTATPNTFAYTKARLALDLPNGLRLSEDELSRLVNRIEETLLLRGKWIGSVEELKVLMPEDGLVYLPYTLETVLGATINDKPIEVYDQTYDYSENGPGFQKEDANNRYPGLIARGERLVNNQRTRVYFIRGNADINACVRILYKRRHIPHTSGSDPLYIRNYPAILEMGLALSLQATAPDQAKYHEDLALQLLNSELKENRGAQRINLRVQAPAFAMSEVVNLV